MTEGGTNNKEKIVDLQPTKKSYDLEVYITNMKHMVVEADSLEQAIEKAKSEARKYMGKDWKSLEIVEAGSDAV